MNFLEEATHMALELGVDRLGADVTALETVPASLHDLLMARLDGIRTKTEPPTPLENRPAAFG